LGCAVVCADFDDPRTESAFCTGKQVIVAADGVPSPVFFASTTLFPHILHTFITSFCTRIEAAFCSMDPRQYLLDGMIDDARADDARLPMETI